MRVLGLLADRNHKRILRHVCHQKNIEIDMYEPDELLDIESHIPYHYIVLAQDYEADKGIDLVHTLFRNYSHLSQAKLLMIQTSDEEVPLDGLIFLSDYDLESDLEVHLVDLWTKPTSAKVLYVSDDRLMHAIIKDLYQQDNTFLIHAYDGEEGYNAYLQHKPDLILTDLDLPKFDGLTLLKKIKIEHNDSQTMVLLFSSTSDEATIMKAYELRAKGYLIKPLKPDILKAKVEKYLHQGPN